MPDVSWDTGVKDGLALNISSMSSSVLCGVERSVHHADKHGQNHLPSVLESTFLCFRQGGTYGHRDDNIVGAFLLECCGTGGRMEVG